MNLLNLSAALTALGILITAQAVAQTSSAQRQPVQSESDASVSCGLAFNANNPSGDPNCKQRTQNMGPSTLQHYDDGIGRKP